MTILSSTPEYCFYNLGFLVFCNVHHREECTLTDSAHQSHFAIAEFYDFNLLVNLLRSLEC